MRNSKKTVCSVRLISSRHKSSTSKTTMEERPNSETDPFYLLEEPVQFIVFQIFSLIYWEFSFSVAVDESLIIPLTNSSDVQSNLLKSNLTDRSREKERVKLPTIQSSQSDHRHHHHHHRHHHHHHGHHHRHHRHRHHHYRDDNQSYESQFFYDYRLHRSPRNPYERDYDPRWWYMPLNSVHGPKHRSIQRDLHYRQAKWYEIPSRS